MRSSRDDKDSCDPDKQLFFGSNSLRECKLVGSRWWVMTHKLVSRLAHLFIYSMMKIQFVHF